MCAAKVARCPSRRSVSSIGSGWTSFAGRRRTPDGRASQDQTRRATMAWVPPVRLPGLPKRDTSRLGLEDPPLNSNSTELGPTSPGQLTGSSIRVVSSEWLGFLYWAQSPGVPDDGSGAGPDGSTSPAQIVRRPHGGRPRDRLARKSRCARPEPPGSIVVWTSPDSTRIDVRTRPDGERTLTVQGRGGREPGSIVGCGPPGG